MLSGWFRAKTWRSGTESPPIKCTGKRKETMLTNPLYTRLADYPITRLERDDKSCSFICSALVHVKATMHGPRSLDDFRHGSTLGGVLVPPDCFISRSCPPFPAHQSRNTALNQQTQTAKMLVESFFRLSARRLRHLTRLSLECPS